MKYVDIFCCLILLSGSTGAGPQVSGSYLGMFNSLYEIGVPDTTMRYRQFDAAGNLDLVWQVHHRVKGNIQLQMVTGGSHLGLATATVTVTDLNLEFTLHRNLYLTVGSFDAPFGMEVPGLSNNAYTSGNAFFLNSLTYGAVVGSNMGTLNTIGVMGDVHCKLGRLSLALSNGTDESALNPDGNFAVIVSGVTKYLFSGFRTGASFIYSPDTSVSGASGTGSHFTGWLLDGQFKIRKESAITAYYGMLKYDDARPDTRDLVTVAKLEASLVMAEFRCAGRLSAWLPRQAAAGLPVNELLPVPDIHRQLSSLRGAPTQEIWRYQLGISWQLMEKLLLKTEWFYENFRVESDQFKNHDFHGIILGVNADF